MQRELEINMKQENQHLLGDENAPGSRVVKSADKEVEGFQDDDLAVVFDQYSNALDLGDDDAAESVLKTHPAIGEEFHVPFRGLYLLERAARQQREEHQPVDPLKPQRIGDYEIQSELGRGGMGIVYTANQISLRRAVALKILPFTAVLDPRQVVRFQNEARSAASLHHPNIVPVFGVGCERGVHYYSMQLIDGQTIAELIEQLRNDPVSDVPVCSDKQTVGNFATEVCAQSPNFVNKMVELAILVARALEYAHGQGIVHRDIKPSNLLLDKTGKIWVADFGLARGRDTSDLTSQGDQLGTLRYMSPEQAAGRNNLVDLRSDVYSLGITLYEMLTFKQAFSGQDRHQLMSAIESDDPVAVRAINSAIGIDLETVISKAISKEPSDRYQSAQEFADDLKRCLEGKPIQAKRKTVFDRCAGMIAKRKRLVVGIGTILLSVALAAVWIAWIFYCQKQREHIAAENARFYLQQAHKTVDRFGTMLTSELETVAGTAALRSKLINEAVGYYDDFLEFASGETDLVFEKAQAHSQLAQLHQRVDSDAEAIRNYRLSIGHFEKLDDTASVIKRAVCLDRLGLLYQHSGKYEQASQSFSQALRLLETLEGEGVDVRVTSAQTQSNLASLLWAQGKPEAARRQFEGAIQRLNLAEGGPSNANSAIERMQQQIALNKITGNFVAMLQQSDPDRAERILRGAIESLKKETQLIHELSDTDVEKHQGFLNENLGYLADMRNNLSVMLCHQGHFEEAKNIANGLIESLDLQRKEAPFDGNVSQRLATAHNTLGEILFRSDANDLADESFEKAQSILQGVLENELRQPETLSCLGAVLHNRSLIAYRRDDGDEAMRMIRLAIDFQIDARDNVPQNARYKTLLKSHRDALNVFEATLGKKDFQRSAALELGSNLGHQTNIHFSPRLPR